MQCREKEKKDVMNTNNKTGNAMIEWSSERISIVATTHSENSRASVALDLRRLAFA